MLCCTSRSTTINPVQFPCIHLSPAVVTCSDSFVCSVNPAYCICLRLKFPQPLRNSRCVCGVNMSHSTSRCKWNTSLTCSYRCPSKKLLYHLLRSFQSTAENEGISTTELEVTILWNMLILEVRKLENKNQPENIMLNSMRAFSPIYFYRWFVPYRLS